MSMLLLEIVLLGVGIAIVVAVMAVDLDTYGARRSAGGSPCRRPCELPALADNAVNQIGEAAGGVALFTIGLMLAQNPVRLDREVLANLGLKSLLQPAIILGAALALRLDTTLTKEVFLIGVMPTATAASVLAQRYGAYATPVSTLLRRSPARVGRTMHESGCGSRPG